MRLHLLEDKVSDAAVWSRRLAGFALILALGAIALSRSRLIEPRGALAVLGFAEALALVALGLALVGAVVIWRVGHRGAGAAFVGFVLSVSLLAPLAALAGLALALPAVRDVSTDLDDPPVFLASSRAFAARGGAPPPAMAADAIAAQRQAYPDLAALLLKTDPGAAYQEAMQAAKDLGWRVIDSQPPGDRGGGLAMIDAIDAGPVLRTDDEIAVRLRPSEDGVLVDLRSVSGLGRHDFGVNARRIRAFLAAMKDANEGR
jgi:hypothetical protein